MQIIGVDLHTRQQTVETERRDRRGLRIQADSFLSRHFEGYWLRLRELGSPHPLTLSPIVAVNILGHVDIHVTQNVMHERRRCAFAQHRAGMHGAEAPKILFIARIGRVQISAKAAC
jgi:hypothetical protein